MSNNCKPELYKDGIVRCICGKTWLPEQPKVKPCDHKRRKDVAGEPCEECLDCKAWIFAEAKPKLECTCSSCVQPKPKCDNCSNDYPEKNCTCDCHGEKKEEKPYCGDCSSPREYCGKDCSCACHENQKRQPKCDPEHCEKSITKKHIWMPVCHTETVCIDRCYHCPVEKEYPNGPSLVKRNADGSCIACGLTENGMTVGREEEILAEIEDVGCDEPSPAPQRQEEGGQIVLSDEKEWRAAVLEMFRDLAWDGVINASDVSIARERFL